MIVRQLLTGIGYVVSKKQEKGARESFKRVKEGAKTLGQFLVAGALAQGFRAAIGYASDAEETLNVVNTAFENQAQAVLDWGRVSGEAAGRSEYAMREFAGAVGAMTGPTLGSAEATAKLSTDMAQLAIDLGSFFNASDEETLDALKAGLIGSSEPLMRFGVVMNEAALQTFAASKGIKQQVKDMDAAAKMQLRYQFIMANTTKAQGDAAKTSEGYANQLKRLGGNMRNILTDVGGQFLENSAGLLQILNKILVVLRGPLTIAFRSVANAIRFTTAVIIGLVEGFTKLDIVTQAVLSALLVRTLALHAPWLLWGVLIAAAVGGVIAILDDLWVAMEGGDSATSSIIGNLKLLRKETGSWSAAAKKDILEVEEYWLDFLWGPGTGAAFQAWNRKIDNGFYDAVGIVGNGVGWIASEIDVGIKGAIDSVIAWVRQVWPKITGFLNQPIKDLLPGVEESLENIEKAISDWIDGVIEDWGDSFENLGNSIADAFDSIGDAIYDVLKRIVGYFEELIDPIWQRVSKFIDIGDGWIGKVFGGLGDLDKLAGLTEPLQMAVEGSPAARRQVESRMPLPQTATPQVVTREATANQSIEVNVNAPGGNGSAIAAAVAPAVGRAAADGNRRIAQQLLAGGVTP